MGVAVRRRRQWHWGSGGHGGGGGGGATPAVRPPQTAAVPHRYRSSPLSPHPSDAAALWARRRCLG